jgi:parvulin-like peptidyl-prolyl isomerase
MVPAAHIIKNVDERTDESRALETIQAIQQELLEEKPFEEVADLRSGCPGRGGDLGFFPRGEMVKDFEDVIFSMKPGESKPIFRPPFGFHIAKLYERKAEGVRALAEVRSDIEQLLIQRGREKCIEQFVDGLRAKADVRKARRFR